MITATTRLVTTDPQLFITMLFIGAFLLGSLLTIPVFFALRLWYFPRLVEAASKGKIREQRTQIDSLRKLNQQRHADNAELRARLKAIEAALSAPPML
jgi:hypothetical protein